MVAGRLRNDLRHPGAFMQFRTRRNGRLAILAVAVMVMTLLAPLRFSGKPGSSGP